MAAGEHESAEPAGGRRPGGALEAEILGLLHAAPQALSPGEVLERLGGDLAYSTVVTVLSRMHDKGLLTRAKRGRAYAYAPVADAHGITARRMRQVLDSDPDREAVLSRFISDLSADDEQLLRQMLDGDLTDGQ
ncbi:BlaI/MecI/CopY family transcriptional regulator [Streptantibioticus rubrisoli]|jgi:predicted transcriptional regulator|uniref:BlaI/MecI/CopY family transcriptional regulator n=1 Tax=Streptantibioticus rubrisoli TaxID=1387313 RepID=A0ABT1PGK6_9ACTN|nr:BlaI/MecI/CopY family transcriptional regulator [Streptantibioticus rubrisoli]MCQ4044497.1 BlaI/MecI/CopY family transcriptional regulator [Streptantibioticus rubrisoli]